MQSLQYFRVQWENYNQAQVDTNEGTIGVIGGTSLENHIDNLKAIGQSDVADFWKNIHEDVKADMVAHYTLVEQRDFYDKIFCLYTFYFNDISKEYQIPCNKLIEFAEEGEKLSVVIIHNPSEFLNRMRLAISEIGAFSFDKVRYKNFHKTQDIDLFGGFHKDMIYSWQQEFRVACREHILPAKPQGEYDIWIPTPLTLSIGCIKDIAVLIPDIESFFDPVQFIKIMADNNIAIKDYIPTQKQLCAYEQDIAYCLYKESIICNELWQIEADALNHYNEAVNFVHKLNNAEAIAKLNDYKKEIHQEPCFTNSISKERALVDIYGRIAKSYFELADKENLLLYTLKFRCFGYRLLAKKIELNNIFWKFCKQSDDFLENFDRKKFMNNNKSATIAVLEMGTFSSFTYIN